MHAVLSSTGLGRSMMVLSGTALVAVSIGGFGSAGFRGRALVAVSIGGFGSAGFLTVQVAAASPPHAHVAP
jgi:hypothetical protein